MAAVASLFDLYRQFYEQPSNLPLAVEFIGSRLARNESLILLAHPPSQPDAPVAFCQLYPSFCSVEAQPIFVLYDLFVTPAARRLGAGRQLLLAAEAAAAQAGKARMDLTTARNNPAAQALYESLGWVRDRVFLTYTRRISSS